MSFDDLPLVNASLNALATVLMIAGWIAVRSGHRRAHGYCMAAAVVVSAVFLVCYVVYHYGAGHTPYEGEGILRPIYFTVLISHIVLAIAVPPLVLRSVYLASRKRWKQHPWWGRLTLPIWLYVSVTGVVVYCMLYGLPL